MAALLFNMKNDIRCNLCGENRSHCVTCFILIIYLYQKVTWLTLRCITEARFAASALNSVLERLSVCQLNDLSLLNFMIRETIICMTKPRDDLKYADVKAEHSGL